MLLVSAASAAPTDLVRYPSSGYSFSFGSRIQPIGHQNILTVQAPLHQSVPIPNLNIPIHQRATTPIIIPQTTLVTTLQSSTPQISQKQAERPLSITLPVTTSPKHGEIFAGIPPSPLLLIALAMSVESDQALPTLNHRGHSSSYLAPLSLQHSSISLV